jgi:predicted nucleic acid-binding protein
MKQMVDLVFVDTNILLDYLENRNKEVSEIFSKLIELNKEGKIVLATSVFNIAELLHKELDIAAYGQCIKKKMSFDDIISLVRNRKNSYEKVLENCRNKLESKIRRLIEKNDLTLLYLPDDMQNMENLYELGFSSYLSSQDAIVVATAIANNVMYFLSKDEVLIKKIKPNDIPYAYDLRKEDSRKTLNDTVLKGFE